MKAREIMTVALTTVRPNTPVGVAAALLTDRNVASLPVIDDDGRLVGIVSEIDLIGDRMPAGHGLEFPAPALRQADPTHRVRQVMTTTVVCLGGGASTADLAEAMVGSNVQAIPIVEGARLIGMVSRRDLLRTPVRQDPAMCAEILERIQNYTGATSGWTVEVDKGAATIRGWFTDAAREAVIVELARTVPGVTSVLAQTPAA